MEKTLLDAVTAAGNGDWTPLGKHGAIRAPYSFHGTKHASDDIRFETRTEGGIVATIDDFTGTETSFSFTWGADLHEVRVVKTGANGAASVSVRSARTH